VLVSSVATLFYLVAYGVTDWYAEDKMALVFVVVLLCVTIPCCFSDILFPLLLIEGQAAHAHDAHCGATAHPPHAESQ
jgi:hypothetical protein